MDGSADPIDVNGARETLESLAVELQSLPVSSLAPAFVLLLGGAALLLFGRHLLRPVLVITSILLGAMLGAPLLGGLFPRLGTGVLTLLGAATGLLAVAVAWRLMYGAALGVVLAAFVALVALVGVDAGLVDARRSPDDAVGRPAPARADPAPAEIASMRAREALVARTPGPLRPLVRWADARWSSEPQQVRSLLSAAAAAGCFIGLVLGSWLPNSAAAFLTSLVGSLFALVGGIPLLARAVGRTEAGPPPIAWLGFWMALAVAGWLFQLSRTPEAGQDGGPSGDEGAKPSRPRRGGASVGGSKPA